MTRREVLEKLVNTPYETDKLKGSPHLKKYYDFDQALSDLHEIEEAERLTYEEIIETLKPIYLKEIDVLPKYAQAILSAEKRKRGEKC